MYWAYSLLPPVEIGLTDLQGEGQGDPPPTVPTVQDYENEEVQLYTYAACSFRGDKTTNQPT